MTARSAVSPLVLLCAALACGAKLPVAIQDGSSQATTARCNQEFGDPAKSKYILPYPVGRTYVMFQGNCPPNPGWGHNGWLAYDFNLDIGDSILASRAGLVAQVREQWPNSDRICGHENAVWIVHDDGSVMVYAHLTTNGAVVNAGQYVQAGALLGYSGDSGCSSGPHLHVNLWRDNSSDGMENTLPINYRNAVGPLDAKHSLIQGQEYTARTP